jgi:hypothetical protein
MLASVTAVRRAVDERRARFPTSPLFLHAEKEIGRIERQLASDTPLDRKFYDSLTIGLMCARELETTDFPFCDTVYAMLTEIRPDR